MKIEWKDRTSYSRNGSRVEPRVWEIVHGPMRVTVHRHIGYAPDAWLVTCNAVGLDCYELVRGLSADEAKKRALQVVHEELSAFLTAVRAMQRDTE